MSIKADKLAKHSILLFILNMAAAGLGYIFQILAGRTMSVEGFGNINSILAFVVTFAAPGIAINALTAKHVATLTTHNDNNRISIFLTRLFRSMATLLTILLFIGLLASPIFNKVLSLGSYSVLFATIVLTWIYYFPYFFTGALAGLGAFFIVGLISLFIPIFKVLGALIILFIPQNTYLQQLIIILCMIVGGIISVVVGHLAVRRSRIEIKFRKPSGQLECLTFSADKVYVLIANLAIIFFMNIDVIGTRLVFGSAEAGYYSSVIMFGRVIYFFTTSLVTVLLPLVATAQAKRQGHLNMYHRCLLYTVILSLLLFIPLNLFPKQLVRFVFGAQYYNSAAIYILPACLISFGLSLNNITVQYLTGQGKTKFLGFLLPIGCFLMSFSVLLLRNSPQSTLMWIAGISIAIFLVGYFYCSHLGEKSVVEKMQ